jgi:hypothetical protein
MGVTTDMEVGNLSSSFRNRPAFDRLVVAQSPSEVEARTLGEYRRSVDEYFLAADAATDEMKALDSRLADLIVVPPPSAHSRTHWSDEVAADDAKALYGRWFRYALNEARAALDSATYEVVTALHGVVEGDVEVGFSKGYLMKLARKYPQSAASLQPTIALIEEVRQCDDFKQFDLLRQIGTHRRIPFIIASGKAHFAGDEPLGKLSMTMWLPEDYAAVPPKGKPHATASGIAIKAILLSKRVVDGLYGVAASTFMP